jgi:hypothetical protein
MSGKVWSRIKAGHRDSPVEGGPWENAVKYAVKYCEAISIIANSDDCRLVTIAGDCDSLRMWYFKIMMRRFRIFPNSRRQPALVRLRTLEQYTPILDINDRIE